MSRLYANYLICMFFRHCFMQIIKLTVFFTVLCKLPVFNLLIFSSLFYANYSFCIFFRNCFMQITPSAYFFLSLCHQQKGDGWCCIVFDITFVSLKMEVFLAVHSFKGTGDQPLRRALMMAFRLGPF